MKTLREDGKLELIC